MCHVCSSREDTAHHERVRTQYIQTVPGHGDSTRGWRAHTDTQVTTVTVHARCPATACYGHSTNTRHASGSDASRRARPYRPMRPDWPLPHLMAGGSPAAPSTRCQLPSGGLPGQTKGRDTLAPGSAPARMILCHCAHVMSALSSSHARVSECRRASAHRRSSCEARPNSPRSCAGRRRDQDGERRRAPAMGLPTGCPRQRGPRAHPIDRLVVERSHGRG